MRILVAFNEYFDTNFLSLNNSKTNIDYNNLRFDIDPFSKVAIEEAVRIKENNPDRNIEIVAVFISGIKDETLIRASFAFGIDRCIFVHDSNKILTPLVVAKVLDKIISVEKPEMILFGKKGSQFESSQVPQMLSSFLGIPFVLNATKIVINKGNVVINSDNDNKKDLYKAYYPIIISSDLSLNIPRDISLPDVIKAKNKVIESISLNDIINHPKKTKIIIKNYKIINNKRKVKFLDKSIEIVKHVKKI